MKNKIYSVIEIKKILFPVFQKYNIKKAVLFGSYAKGVAGENSDIDIMVDSGLKGLAFYGLLEDVVVAVGKSVDLIDKTQITNSSKIQQEIASKGIVIYG